MVTDKVFWSELYFYIKENLTLSDGIMAVDIQQRARTSYIIQKLWKLASEEYIKNVSAKEIVSTSPSYLISDETYRSDDATVLWKWFMIKLFESFDMNISSWFELHFFVNQMYASSYYEFLQYYSTASYVSLLGNRSNGTYGINKEIEQTWDAIKLLIKKKQKENSK